MQSVFWSVRLVRFLRYSISDSRPNLIAKNHTENNYGRKIGIYVCHAAATSPGRSTSRRSPAGPART